MSFASTLAVTATALAGVAGACAWGGLSYESQLFGKSLVSPPLPGQLALTFDDGPNPSITPHLLEVLALHQARATFFLIGDYALREPALTRQIYAAGHIIGNHTMHHAWLPRHSNACIREEMRTASQTIEDILGAPVALFRPPHGARRPYVFRAARELNLQVVLWNVIVGDWKLRSADDLVKRIQSGMAHNQGRKRGTNLVLHDGSQHGPAADRRATVHAVAALLDRLEPETRIVTPLQWA